MLNRAGFVRWPWASTSTLATLLFGCFWAVLAAGQAYLARLNFARGSTAVSPWFNVAFACAYAFIALANFWRYRKLTATEAAASSGSAYR